MFTGKEHQLGILKVKQYSNRKPKDNKSKSKSRVHMHGCYKCWNYFPFLFLFGLSFGRFLMHVLLALRMAFLYVSWTFFGMIFSLNPISFFSFFLFFFLNLSDFDLEKTAEKLQ